MKPRPASKVPVRELHEALEQVLCRHFDGTCRIRTLRRRASAYSSSYAIENLELTLERGRHLSLVFKDLSPASLLATAQRVRPHFLYEPLREIEIYRKVLASSGLGTPVCYGAIDSPELERYWLFLERVEGPLLWQTGRMQNWHEAARWLARLHNQYDTARYPWDQSGLQFILQYNEKLFGLWLTRAETFLRRKFSFDNGDIWRGFSRLAARYDRVIDRLLALPATLIHGEFFPSNIILRANGKRRQICPIDWEVAALGPGLLDLAALTAGDWSRENKRALVATYFDAWEPAGRSRLSLAELLEAVDFCQLHISVQLLGWAADWSPPERHARNWLREAFQLAKSVGL